MTEIDGLLPAECDVVDPLDAESPMPLWKIAGQRPGRSGAEYFGPAVVAMARRGCVEVRRFAIWPPPGSASFETNGPRVMTWPDGGRPLDLAELASAVTEHAEWLPGRTADVLVAHITAEGVRFL